MKLIIINGLPGTGKTTIAKPLALKLNVPLISKDTIKEFLFDTIGIGDREWSKMLGRASSEFLYTLTDNLLAGGHSLIIESAFEVSFAKPAVQTLIDTYHPEVYEIYCTTDKIVRRQRFIARNESGNRHAGHVDEVNYPTDDEPEPLEKYAPLELGTLITVDSSRTKVDIDDLAKKISS